MGKTQTSSAWKTPLAFPTLPHLRLRIEFVRSTVRNLGADQLLAVQSARPSIFRYPPDCQFFSDPRTSCPRRCNVEKFLPRVPNPLLSDICKFNINEIQCWDVVVIQTSGTVGHGRLENPKVSPLSFLRLI